MATAIVTGATGITGSAIVDALCKDSRYSKIYTLSRSQRFSSTSDKIKHSHIDLQSSAQDMAKDLAEVSGSVIFFSAYLARDDEVEATKVNRTMLQNFLEALEITGAIKQLKRVVMTCGLKQYGVHLGRVKQPMHEDDESIVELAKNHEKFPSNFYYAQQKVLVDAAMKSNGSWSWTVTFPQDVLGFAKGNFMNECTALGLYASVAKLAHPNSELPFPGSKANYLGFNCWTSSKLHAKFCLWAAHAPNAAGQSFNVVNGDTESWQHLWPKLAKRYGCTVPEDMFAGGARSTYRDFDAVGPNELNEPPPVSVQAKGFGCSELGHEKSTVYQQIDTVKWAKDSKVLRGWEALKDKYGLEQETWDKATWGFLTFVLGREYSCVVSMSKARKMGWNGYEDTWDSFEDVFQQLEGAGILPPVSKLKGEKSLA